VKVLFELTVANYIDAAHLLRGYQGKCANIHGHTWRVEVTLKGEQLNEIGLLVDFNDVKSLIKEVTLAFDHKLINEVAPFDQVNPSSENLAKYLFHELIKGLSAYKGIQVVKVMVSESRDTAAVYYE
jgi:6-pyruvoyltetrahydropterin/6-carboxytetrahydropterin synthase